MGLSNSLLQGTGALVAITAGLAATINWPITALQISGVEVIAAAVVVALITLLFVWLIDEDHGSESIEDESDTEGETEPSAPRPSDHTSENPPSVWTEGNDPTTLGDSRTTEENTTNQPNPDSKPTDETPHVTQVDFEFHWATSTDVSMDDVGGMDEIKQELNRDIVLPLTEGREKAEKLNLPLPNVLFHGPPGTGKTYLAKALATELGFPFVKLSGGDLQSKWINESANKINQLFTEAKQIAAEEGGAVVFIDEIDSVLKARGDSANTHAEDDKVVNELLNQLESTTQGVLVIGATNRLEALDAAGVRSGRFTEKIHVGKPDQDTREAIFRAQLADRPHALTDEHIEALAAATEGEVPAAIEAHVVQSARNCAFQRGGEVIRWTDFDQD